MPTTRERISTKPAERGSKTRSPGRSSSASRGPPSLWAFLRIGTNPRAFERPLSIGEAQAAVSSWLAQPPAGILEPGERHWPILCGLMRDGQTTGPLVMDAVVAALAVEHGATLYTTDRDFSRFVGLKWTNPLAAQT